MALPHGLDSIRLRRDLLALVRGRVPERDAEDVVQSALMDAIVADGAPDEAERFRQFAFGITRHKIADYHRKNRRETFELPELTTSEPRHEDRELAQWAEQRLPAKDGAQTFEWLLREGDGEKLEHIAADADVPPPRVRKRVSRLREHFRAHWKEEIALLAALGIASLVVLYFSVSRSKQPIITQDHTPPEPSRVLMEPTEELNPEYRRKRASEIRESARQACEQGRYHDCVAELDRAKAIDPAGDLAPEVVANRARASAALSPEPKSIKMKEASPTKPPPTKRAAPKSTTPFNAKPTSSLVEPVPSNPVPSLRSPSPNSGSQNVGPPPVQMQAPTTRGGSSTSPK